MFQKFLMLKSEGCLFLTFFQWCTSDLLFLFYCLMVFLGLKSSGGSAHIAKLLRAVPKLSTVPCGLGH